MASVYETIETSISAMRAVKTYSILLASFVKWFSFTFFHEMIYDSTDNLTNVKEFNKEAKKLCLVDDPRYKILENHCFYFEKHFSYFDSANENWSFWKIQALKGQMFML